MIAHPECKVSKYISAQVSKLIKKRTRGIPLAYLTGHKEFFGLDFVVNKHTLIPRPETELIVSLALDKIRTTEDHKIILIDVGTGSGCIPISVIKTSKLQNFKTFAIDISQKALTVARRNAKKHHVKASLRSAHVAGKIKFLQGNLLSSIPPLLKRSKEDFDQLIITANLPYLTNKQFKQELSIQHEPQLALIAGNDGLKYYRQLLKQIQNLTPYVLRLMSFFEIDPSQTSPIKLLIKKYLPQAKIKTHKDLGKKNRVIEINV